MQKTAEFVSPKHPDKICDQIADALLDFYAQHDPNSRVAIEVLGGHGEVTITGEVTSQARMLPGDMDRILAVYLPQDTVVHYRLSQQSPEISRGVNTGGAGDQGIMTGYACQGIYNDYLPMEYFAARELCRKIFERFPFDGKTQVTIEDGKVKTVVASFQNAPKYKLEQLVRQFIKCDNYLINPAGDWQQGGFDADTGLTGRKLVVDNYGPEIPIGGGSFSGKDWTKMDRTGAYMARFLAREYLVKRSAREVHTKLAYAIGKAEPVMALAIVDGKPEKIQGYNLTPQGIYETLGLRNVKFADTAKWGHFGRNFPWG